MSTPWKQPKRFAPIEPKPDKPRSWLETGWQPPKKWDDPPTKAPRRPTYLDRDWGNRRPEPARDDYPEESVADYSVRIAMHEAAHAAANYLLGGEVRSVEAKEREGCTVKARMTDHPVADAVTWLAGLAWDRSRGLPLLSANPTDIEGATKALAREFSGPALDRACKVAEEAALSLVGMERFQRLVYELGAALVQRRYLGDSKVLRILEEADPERSRSTEQRSSARSWYLVTDADRREVYRGSSRDEAHRVLKACEQGPRHGLLIGSDF